MKRQLDQKHKLFFIAILLVLFLSSCATVSNTEVSRFSLGQQNAKLHENAFLMGSISYGKGFFFPSDTDILDISLLKVDSTTGLMTEISHLRYRNLQKFPIPFSMVYDKADVTDSTQCTIIVTLSVDGKLESQAIGQILYTKEGFEEVTLVLM